MSKAVVKNYTQMITSSKSGVTALVGSINHHDNGRPYIQGVNMMINMFISSCDELYPLMHFKLKIPQVHMYVTSKMFCSL